MYLVGKRQLQTFPIINKFVSIAKFPLEFANILKVLETDNTRSFIFCSRANVQIILVNLQNFFADRASRKVLTRIIIQENEGMFVDSQNIL